MKMHSTHKPHNRSQTALAKQCNDPLQAALIAIAYPPYGFRV